MFSEISKTVKDNHCDIIQMQNFKNKANNVYLAKQKQTQIQKTNQLAVRGGEEGRA